MTPAAFAALACPSCRRDYVLHGEAEGNGEVLRGRLACDGCGLQFPVLDGFALFTEPRMHADQLSPAALEALEARLFGDRATYDAYRAEKHQRGLWEAYAAFQPFNESTRAAEPLLATLAAHLRPGDVILDSWARTGWSGVWLAGLFPDNPVISVWEGDSSVLAYRGYRHWLGSERRPANLSVLFVPPNRPLPLGDGRVGAIYALDCLHRFDLYPFAAECLRVARPDAALLFAHLHLTNSEPEPFFERGCRQSHGADYRAWLDQVLAADQRQGWVFSEADLFNGRPGDVLADTPDTDHYNGAVLIADPSRTGLVVPPPAAPGPDCRFLLNPLLRLRPGRGDLLVDEAHLGGEVKRLLDRHPVYRARLPDGPVALSQTDWLVVSLALTGATLGEINHAVEERSWSHLLAAEVLLPVQVGAAGLDLQRFHANQAPPGDADQVLPAWLGRLADESSTVIDLADGATLTGEDLARAVGAAMRLLDQDGFRPGDPVALPATSGPLNLVLLIAALACGLEIALGERNGPVAGPVRVADEGLSARLGALLDDPRPPPPARPGGRLLLTIDGLEVVLEGAWLMEVAGSLRHGAAGDRSTVSSFGDLPRLLFCLATLLRGDRLMIAA